LVLSEGIFFRGHAAVAEPGGDGFDVVDLPSEDSALQRSGRGIPRCAGRPSRRSEMGRKSIGLLRSE
jgi:hypothetical protein